MAVDGPAVRIERRGVRRRGAPQESAGIRERDTRRRGDDVTSLPPTAGPRRHIAEDLHNLIAFVNRASPVPALAGRSLYASSVFLAIPHWPPGSVIVAIRAPRSRPAADLRLNRRQPVR